MTILPAEDRAAKARNPLPENCNAETCVPIEDPPGGVVLTDWGKIAAERLDKIARISGPGPGVTRLPFTPEHRHAVRLITDWMTEAGLAASLDAAGTVVGRLAGPQRSDTFYMGSHQDSVREGGAFDGIMGVVLPILAIQKLRDDGVTLPFAVECLAFADEEGVRFPTALIGPRALAGTFDPAVLEMADRDGVLLRAAMRDFGLDPDRLAMLQRDSAAALGYLETHIEQGPVLEEAGEALGVVTAICGIERHQLTLTGETGHAGTLPMASRRDALVGAAAVIAEVHRMASETAELRATVGSLSLEPNVVNAVPREVRLTIELRSPGDAVRDAAGQHMQAFSQDVATRHGLRLKMQRSYQQQAQPCDGSGIARLRQAVQAGGGAGLLLPSGATHDASAMADLCPISMLFVRCRNGVSHVPEEHASAGDMGKAVDAIAAFLIATGAAL